MASDSCPSEEAEVPTAIGAILMTEVPEKFRAFKPKEVADALRMISESTLRKMARAEEIPHHIGPKNSLWFTADDIDEMLRKLHRPARQGEPLEQLVIEEREINPFRVTSRSATAHRSRANA